MLRQCHIEGCERASDREDGGCVGCGYHFCAVHLDTDAHYHRVEHLDPDAIFGIDVGTDRYRLDLLLKKINPEALKKAAEAARGANIACEIPAFSDTLEEATRDHLVSDQIGGINLHLDINFDDGVTWIVRLRRILPYLDPPEVQDHIFLSEVATLKFLATTEVPAPRIYGYELESTNNAVGPSYILMGKMEGHALQWESATLEQRNRVMDQLVDIYLELEKHPFTRLGSPSLSTTSSDSFELRDPIKIGVGATGAWFETLTQSHGPFDTAEACYEAALRLDMRLISRHEVCNLRSVDSYLAVLWQLEMLPLLLEKMASPGGPFYLNHGEDKGDHILVDDQYNITGIIDWEFSSTELKEVAFSTPNMIWSIAEFCAGDNTLNEHEIYFAGLFDQKGRTDLGDMMRGSRRWQRFPFSCGDEERFEARFQAFRECFVEDPTSLSSFANWKKDALARYAEDPGLQALLRGE